MRPVIASRRTLILTGSSLLAAAAVAILTAYGNLSDGAATAMSDIAGVLLIGLSAAVVLITANSMGPAGRPWKYIGMGMLVYLMGDLSWTYTEVLRQAEVPYPGLPDLFYLSSYVLFALGMIRAGLAYRGLVPLKTAATGAVAIGAVLSMILYASVIRPHILVGDASVLERFVSSAYPLGDVLFMFAPAMFVALVIVSLAGGRFGVPWQAVTAGTIVFAAADCAYVVIESIHGYETNALIEFGWSAGFLLIMLGALIAHDLSRPIEG